MPGLSQASENQAEDSCRGGFVEDTGFGLQDFIPGQIRTRFRNIRRDLGNRQQSGGGAKPQNQGHFRKEQNLREKEPGDCDGDGSYGKERGVSYLQSAEGSENSFERLPYGFHNNRTFTNFTNQYLI